MLRKVCLIALAAALAVPAFGAVIRSDAYALRLDLETGTDPDAYAYPPVSVSLGYFPADNIEVGGVLGIRNADWNSYWITGNVWELGLFGELHFDVDYRFHPLVGARLSMLDGEKDSDTVYQLFIYGGGKYFLSENMALALSAGLAFATESIYNADTETKANKKTSQSGDAIGLLLNLGLRYYF